ncbi:GyrI-like domain-containing protein [Ruania albidiflava]|uniref:GyrI-like domain-containing protein n=1 Tax=Ruania albidiflava TaxID=366586 RepID=UPI0003B45EB1|nr:GyrI-like domain-containing protein [Ruania albidiflava]
MAERVDLTKELDSYRARRGEFRVLDLPTRRYLMIDGHGDPNSATFTTAVESLYPVAYTLKFASKHELGRDYVVPPLEGLWWAEDMSTFTTARDKSAWDWTLLLLVPDWVSPAMVEAAIEQVDRTKVPPRLADVRLEELTEGRCVQTLHIGPFDAETDVLAQLHQEVIPAHGFTLAGKHHEIYLSDVRRTAPHRLRTILRQPVTGGRT